MGRPARPLHEPGNHHSSERCSPGHSADCGRLTEQPTLLRIPAPTPRPGARSSLFGRSELIRCTEGTLFGNSTPKLPSLPLLAFDEIIEISSDGGKFGRGYAIARKRLSSMSWVFDSHFPEDPVMPGTMLIEGLLQLAGFFGAYAGERGKGRVARVDEVKFLAEVTPQDEEILYRIDVRKHNREQKLLLAEGRVVAGGTERATVGSLLLVVLRHREPRH